MSKEIRMSIEILRTTNKATNKTRYFKKVCDFMTRISLVEYDEIRDKCFGVNSLFTTSTKNHIKHFTGCTYYINKAV